MTPPKPLPTPESVTDLRECNHGTPPITNCPRCLVRELVEALENDVVCAFCHYYLDICKCSNPARAVLDKAKQVDDCIPYDEASEAAADQGHRYG